jgi:acetyltransferase-like isoleucine patch superfamily enzyme
MTLQALAPYAGEPEAGEAVERALEFLSFRQQDDGGYASFGTKNPESAAQVLVALSSLGIDCTEDARFIKNGCTILDVAEVTMGDWVMVGPHVLISTVNHPLSPRGRRNRLGVAKPVRIGDDVWIGGHATILPGVTIGDGAVVAAGAVVTKDVSPCTVVAGVPARVVKKIEDDLDGWVEGELLA